MKKRHHLGTIGTLLGSLTLTGLALTAALALPAVSLAADTKGAAATLSSGDKDFIKEADKGKDSELTSWAKQTLPTLQDHLKMARDAETKVKGG